MASLPARSLGTPDYRILGVRAGQKSSWELSSTRLAFDKRRYSINGLKILRNEFFVRYMDGEFLFDKTHQIQHPERIEYPAFQQRVGVFDLLLACQGKFVQYKLSDLHACVISS